MLLDAFGFPLKTKKPDDQLIKSIVRLKRRQAELEDEESKMDESEEEEKKPSGNALVLIV